MTKVRSVAMSSVNNELEATATAVSVSRTLWKRPTVPMASAYLLTSCQSSPEHAMANESSVDIHMLQGQEFVAFEKDVPTRRLIDNILAQYNVSVHIVMEFDNTETIKRAVEINAGVSILPETTIQTEVANRKLKAVPFLNRSFFRPTGVLVRKNKSLTQAGRYLIELLHKKAQDNYGD